MGELSVDVDVRVEGLSSNPRTLIEEQKYQKAQSA